MKNKKSNDQQIKDMNEETLKNWITQYESNKTLPSKKLPCTSEGCQTETTAFGTNLAGKVEKAGNIRALLTGFKCRSCKKAAKTTQPMSNSLKEGIKSLRTQRTAELVKAATVDPTTEVSTDELLSVFNDGDNPF